MRKMRRRIFKHSDFITIRIEKAVKEKLQKAARRQNKVVSDVIRELIDAYLEAGEEGVD